MTPIEKMAQAYWGDQWRRMGVDEKELALDDMRAALRALAEIELPSDVVLHGTTAGFVALEYGTAPTEHAFRAICRALAEESAPSEKEASR